MRRRLAWLVGVLCLPGGGGYTRSVAVEKFSYNSDGTIPPITMTTAGAPAADTLNPYVRQEAETIASESGIETEPAGEGGMNVGWIENGDWTKVRDGSTNLQWQLVDVGGGYYRIVNRGTGTALDGAGNATVGSTVVLWAPNNSTNNQWTVTAT
jgi:hypothetical protein